MKAIAEIKSGRLKILLLGLDLQSLSEVASRIVGAEVLAFREPIRDRDVMMKAFRQFMPDLVISRTLAPGLREGNGDVKQSLRLGVAGEGSGPVSLAEAGRTTRAPKLNPQQMEVLLMLYRGLQNNEIARYLGVSTRTVKGYLTRLFVMFDVSNRT